MTNPFMIPQPFANNGNKNDIKNIRESSDPIQTASWLTGFPPTTMTPKEAGGSAPNGLDMNGVLNAVSQGLVHRQRGERMQFSFAYATSIGGYPKGAIIQSDDMTKEFQSLVANNVTNPNTTLGAFWKIYAGDGSVADGSQTQKGLVQFATPQQVQDKLDIARAINPADVVRMFRGGFSDNDSIVLPTGHIIKWGYGDEYNGASGYTQTITFNDAFPTSCLFAMVTTDHRVGNAVNQNNWALYGAPTKTSLTAVFNEWRTGGEYSRPRYLAIGY